MQHPTTNPPIPPSPTASFEEQVLTRLDEIIGLLDAIAEAVVVPAPEEKCWVPLGVDRDNEGTDVDAVEPMTVGGLLFVDDSAWGDEDDLPY